VIWFAFRVTSSFAAAMRDTLYRLRVTVSLWTSRKIVSETGMEVLSSMRSTFFLATLLNVEAKGRINIGDNACQVRHFSGASAFVPSAFAPCLRKCKSTFDKIVARSKESEL
jgi:hypothetical protein